jgi:ABC-type Na+ transport system ATPase subunit NatA
MITPPIRGTAPRAQWREATMKAALGAMGGTMYREVVERMRERRRRAHYRLVHGSVLSKRRARHPWSAGQIMRVKIARAIMAVSEHGTVDERVNFLHAADSVAFTEIRNAHRRIL